jgi:hypothetical protein
MYSSVLFNLKKRVMRKTFIALTVITVCISGIVSCKKQGAAAAVADQAVSEQTLAKIKALGFSDQNVRKDEDGYLVEDDIVLSDELLDGVNDQQLLRIASTEQYRTTNLVTSLPRTISIKVTNLGTAFIQGADLAISRYNALNLRLRLQRITSGTADITIRGFNEAPSGGFITLGSAGFPTSSGAPYRTIKMNTNAAAYGSNPAVTYVGSVIQHELGHCIGMRHTDYMNRSYSCGGTAVNEGASTIGAILIPGTPSGPDANSWMLACSNGGNRTFNGNDVVALNYLY